MYVVYAYVCTYLCRHICRPEVNLGNLPLLLPTVFGVQCVCVCMWIPRYTCTCKRQRKTLGAFFFLWLLSEWVSCSLKSVFELCRLACQGVLGIQCLYPPPTTLWYMQTCLVFYVGAGKFNSDTHACPASTFTH